MYVLSCLWIVYWLLRISAEDIKTLTIPDAFSLAIIAAAPFACHEPLALRLLAAACPLVLTGVLGMGDIKLLGALGFTLGPAALIHITLKALLAGGLYAALLLLLRKAKKKDRIAFGPFISFFAAVYLLSSAAM